MSSHAAPRPLSKRLLKPIAIGAVMLLGAFAMTEGAHLSPAQAAANLSCDQNTVYAISSGGAVTAINAATGTTTDIPTSFSPANNALAVTPNGTAAYATVQATGDTTDGTIVKYDPSSGTATSITGVTVPLKTFRGAVDPLTGIYYYAQGGMDAPAVYAFDTNTDKPIGLVGHLSDITVTASTGNGDFAFSTSGQLFVASGSQVLRVDQTLPTTTGDVALHSVPVVNLPTNTNTPGIAFSTSGYLYVASAKNLLQIDPSSGSQVKSVAISSGLQPTDLASCNYADTVSAKTSISARWQSGDQFTLSIAGGGLSVGNTATTAGADPGLQPETAGSSLVVAGNTYTATETASGTTDLANYTTTYRVTDRASGAVVDSGTGRSVSLSLPAGSKDSDYSVLFTNTLIAVHAKAVGDSHHIGSGQTLTVAGPGLLADDDGTGKAIVSSTPASNGTVTVDTSTGGFTYVPNDGFAGADSFTYTIKDSSGQQSTATERIVVGPTVANDSGTVTANQTLTKTAATGVLSNDSGDQLTASKDTGPQHGQLTLNPDGSYAYTPDVDYSGPDSFTYKATDSDGVVATGTVSLVVLPSAANDDLGTTPYDTAKTIASSTPLANDKGTGLTITAVGTPTSGTATLSDDRLSILYKPLAGFSGKVSFDYTATDTSGQHVTATDTIRVTPVATADDLESVQAGSVSTTTSATLLGNDRGSGLTITGVSAPANGDVSLSDDGKTVTFTPLKGFSGHAQFDYTVTDGSGQTSTATASIVVTPAVSPTTTTAISGQKDSVSADDGVLSGSNGTGLTVDATPVTPPADGELVLNTDGSYDYTPKSTFSGTDSFTYSAHDSSGMTTQGTVTITVVPSAADDTLAGTKAGTLIVIPADDLLGNDSGLTTGQGLSIASVSTPQHGTARLNSDGTVSYRPAAGWSGPDTFTYTVTDGSTVSEPATVTVNVAPVAVNDTVPSTVLGTDAVIDPAALVSNDKGNGLHIVSVQNPSLGSVKLNDDGTVTYSPTPGFSGTYTFGYTVADLSTPAQRSTAKATITVAPAAGTVLVTAPAGGTDSVKASGGLLSQTSGTGVTLVSTTDPANGTLEVGANGAFDYTPKDGFSGTDSFTYTVKDASGTTSTGTVSITVKPTANPDSASALSGKPSTFTTSDLLDNDHGTALGIVSLTQPVAADGRTPAGTVVDDGDGTVTFTADPMFSGPATFTYTVEDKTHQTSTATVSVSVAPVAKKDSGTTPSTTKLSVPAAAGLLANDSGSGLTAALAASPSHGTALVAADGSYSYAPTGSFSGVDSFTYTVKDGSGQTTTAVVTIRVNPLAGDDSLAALAGSSLHVDGPGIVGNDRGLGIAVTSVGSVGVSAPGTPAVFTTAKGGKVTVTADGTFDYVPAAGFSGIDSFPYTIGDTALGSATGTITVTVAPRAVDDTFSTPAGTALTVRTSVLSGNDLGTALAVSAIGTGAKGVQHGTLVTQSNGDYLYTPNAGFSGTDSFAYTVTGQDGGTATAVARILVGDRAADYASTTAAGTRVSKSAADGLLKDGSGTGLSAKLDQDGAHGHATVNADGSYSYLPTGSFSGTDTFTYSIVDGSGQVSTGIVTVTVMPRASNDTESTVTGKTIVVGGPQSGRKGLLGNDSGTGLTVVNVTKPIRGGTATVSGGGVLTYTPAPGFSGTDTFTYQVKDLGGQLSAPATVTVTVAPLAVADSGATTVGRTLRVSAADGLLSDDSGTGLTAALASQAKHGTVKVNRDGSYTYVPKAGYVGTDVFTYTATDASGQVVTAKVTITVAPGAHARNDSVKGTPNKKATVDILANDIATSNATFDAKSIELIDPSTGVASSSVTLEGKGTFRVSGSVVTFAPEHNFHGVAAVHYTVNDSDGVSIGAIIRVTYPTVVAAAITAAAAPVASALAFTGSAGTSALAATALLAMIAGLGLLIGRRFKRPEPGPRRTGV